MTEDTSPENLRKFLESDDPAMVRMGLSMAKGAGVSGEILGEILWMYMFHDDKTIRAAAKSTFIKIAPEDAKRAVKKSWKAEYREKPAEHDQALSSLIRGLKRPIKVVKPLFRMFGPLPWRAESETTQLAASRALGELGIKNDEVCDFLLSKFGESKKGIKEKIIISLGLTRNRKSIPVLKPLLKDKNLSFRKIVAEAMNNLNYKPEETEDKLDLYIADRDWDSCVSLGEPAFDHLLKLLEGRGNKDIKPELCTTIGKFNDKRAIPILIKYTSNRDSSLLNSAALALGSMRAVEAVATLINAITVYHIPRAGNDSINATSRVEALGMIGDLKALAPIDRLRKIVGSGMSSYSYGFNHYNLWQTHSDLLHSCEVSLSQMVKSKNLSLTAHNALIKKGAENLSKRTLSVLYEIVYNKEKFDPVEEVMLRIQHPHTMEFVDVGDFIIEPDTDKRIEERNAKFPFTHEMRSSTWEIEIINERWKHLFAAKYNDSLKNHFKFFQFNQKTGKCEENYDENKIRMIKIVNLTADI